MNKYLLQILTKGFFFICLLIIGCNINTRKNIAPDINEILKENNLGKYCFEKDILPHLSKQNIKQVISNPNDYNKVIRLYNIRFDKLYSVLGEEKTIDYDQFKNFKKQIEKQKNFTTKYLISDLENKPDFKETLVYFYLDQANVDIKSIKNISNYLKDSIFLKNINNIFKNEVKSDNNDNNEQKKNDQFNHNEEQKENDLNLIDINYKYSWKYCEQGPSFKLWIDIPHNIAKDLEYKFRNSKKQFIEFQTTNQKYILNILTFKQTNLISTKQRELIRESKINKKSKIDKKSIHYWQYWVWQSDNHKIQKDYGGTWFNMNEEISDIVEYNYQNKVVQVYIPFKGSMYLFEIPKETDKQFQINTQKNNSKKIIRRVQRFKDCDICYLEKDWYTHLFKCQKPTCDKFVCLSCIKKSNKNKCLFCTNNFLNPNKFMFKWGLQ